MPTLWLHRCLTAAAAACLLNDCCCLQEKKPAAFGWDAFNQQAIFNAAERRSAKIQPDLEEYK